MNKYHVHPENLWPDTPNFTPVYLASEVDARIAEHSKDWDDAAKERVRHLARIAELEKELLERGGHKQDCPISWNGECYCGWLEMKQSLMVT